MKKKKPFRLFKPGKVVVIPHVLEKVSGDELTDALTRHLRGDWGDVSSVDKMSNNQAVQTRGQILSAYKSEGGVTFWIITDADRSATTILLPSDLGEKR